MGKPQSHSSPNTSLRRRGRGEGAVVKRADGRWEAKLDLGWADGRRVRRSFYGRTRIDAVEQLRRAQRAVEEGEGIPGEHTTIGQFLDQWLAEVVKPNRRLATWQGYEVNVRRHIKPVVGRTRLARLSAADVQKLINALRAKGLAPRTVQYAHATLRAALGVALRWGLVRRNVATLVEPVSVPKHEAKPFGLDEARRVLDATSSDRLAAFFAVAMSIGLRPSEALGLCWSDIDFDGRLLRVRHVLERRRGGEVVLKPPKSRTSRRSIPLPAVCVDALIHHRRRQAEERLVTGQAWIGSNLGELVFTKVTGRATRPNLCVQALRRSVGGGGTRPSPPLRLPPHGGEPASGAGGSTPSGDGGARPLLLCPNDGHLHACAPDAHARCGRGHGPLTRRRRRQRQAASLVAGHVGTTAVATRGDTGVPMVPPFSRVT
jgi:integrase